VVAGGWWLVAGGAVPSLALQSFGIASASSSSTPQQLPEPCCPLLSFPLPCSPRFIIGQPITVPPLAVEGQPSAEEVDALHARFYTAVRELWDAHAKEFPGYEDVKLVVAEKDTVLAA